MIKYECDRCGEQTTDVRKMVAVTCEGGLGASTSKDLCADCHRALVRWISEAPARQALVAAP